jgi:hypothetical protein
MSRPFASKHLPKYSSMPELQLAMKEKPLYHCCPCGFTNSLINPMCLWCTWTCKEAKHGFKSSMPRARRASAPSRVYIQIDLFLSSGKFALLAPDRATIVSHRSAAPSQQTETNIKLSVIDPPPFVPSISPYIPPVLVDPTTVLDRCITSHRDHLYDIDTNMVNGNDPVTVISQGFGDTAIATRSV